MIESILNFNIPVITDYYKYVYYNYYDLADFIEGLINSIILRELDNPRHYFKYIIKYGNNDIQPSFIVKMSKIFQMYIEKNSFRVPYNLLCHLSNLSLDHSLNICSSLSIMINFKLEAKAVNSKNKE